MQPVSVAEKFFIHNLLKLNTVHIGLLVFFAKFQNRRMKDKKQKQRSSVDPSCSSQLMIPRESNNNL